VRGDIDGALNDPHSLVLTESAAAKYFGNDDPVGRSVEVQGGAVFTITLPLRQDVHPADSPVLTAPTAADQPA
jgi:putative ABC transport system permease protein